MEENVVDPALIIIKLVGVILLIVAIGALLTLRRLVRIAPDMVHKAPNINVHKVQMKIIALVFGAALVVIALISLYFGTLLIFGV